VPLSLASTLLQSHDTGVSPTRTRRRFTAAYQLKTLEAAAQCTKLGELGALLRREGLYSSHLSVWRTAAQRGELAASDSGAARNPRRPIRA
jgi:transposase